ncbi:MAG: hypothetical protein A3G71_02090 [Gammaproteobacteria bacterium RIFCSPLOWO2_12_FULL_38_14]|nr:MAG: hypothetical protein A3G71_02090 [Gammaproteobacteria bacterium RIFCSPLOWO2_12_FULL_38_14]
MPTSALLQNTDFSPSAIRKTTSYQNIMAIEPYLKQLEDESEEQLIKILTQQDTNGWSIGMAIVRWRDTTTTQKYLQLLENAFENEKLTSKQFTMILTQQNTDGSFIGMFIASRQNKATIQQYLQLLENTFKNGKLTSEQLTTILMQQNEKGWSVGMSITTMKNGAIIRQYLQLLENMLENGKLTSEQFTTILTQENISGLSVGILIAAHQDKTATQQYRQLLETALMNEKLTSEQLTTILTQKDKDDVSVETLLIYQDTKQYEILKNINLFMKTTEKFSSLLEFKKAIKQLENLFLQKDPVFKNSQKYFLNNKIKNLMSDLNSRISDRKTEKYFFEFLKNIPNSSLFYTSALISRLKFETLDSATLNTISFKLDELAKTHFDYDEGQRALADYYIGLLSQKKRELTSHELLQFLIHAQRCTPPHVMLDGAYGMLKDYFNAKTEEGARSSHESLLTTAENFPPQDNESKSDILLKKVLKNLVSLLSNNLFALKRLEGILNLHNEDALLDFYLERVLFHASETEKSSKNISNFFKLVTLPLHPTNKSRKIQITPEQCQELENLSSLNKPYNDAKESVATLIDEFNKGKITEAELFTELRNNIKEKSSDYLQVACNERSEITGNSYF